MARSSRWSSNIMRRRPGIVMLVAALAIVAGTGFWLLQKTSPSAPVTFDPPYPEFNANGDPIFAVFEGRIPCDGEDCRMLKIGLVFYGNGEAEAPATYWLGRIGLWGNERSVTTGRWTMQRGVKNYPDAIVYKLDSNAPANFQLFWRVNDNVLLPLDRDLNPKAGNSAWGSMLSRYNAPYGPRTYR